MASQKKMVLCLLLSLLNICLSLPAPQTSNTIPGSSFESDSQDQNDDEDYYYEEYDEEDDSGPPGLPDLTGLLGEIGKRLPGLIQLIQTKVAIINNILKNKEFQERIGETIEVGGNLVHRIIIPVASRVIPVAINLAGRIPELLKAGGNIVQAGKGAIDAFNNRRPEFKSNGKNSENEILAVPTRVLGSLVKATKDTSPRIIQGLTELDSTIGFVSPVVKVLVEQNQIEARKTADTFHNSFNCDFECRGLTGTLRQRCEKKFCKNSNDQNPRTPRMRKYFRRF